MPMKKGKSFTDVNKGIDSFTENVSKNKGRALLAAAITGAERSKIITPMDTSNLVNSQYIDQSDIQTKGKVRVGFSANYAAAVHKLTGKLKGKIRPDGKGKYWDPAGEPQFLSKGFEGENKSAIDDAFYKALKL